MKDGTLRWGGGSESGNWTDFGSVIYPSMHADPVELNLASGWRAAGGEFADPQVFKYRDMCLLTGMVRSQHSDMEFWNPIIATLPLECRPLDGNLLFGVNH